MNIINLIVIFVIGMLTGSFSTLVGGTALFTIPALIFLGLSPQTAIATSKLGLIGVNIAGWYKFHQKRMINYKISFIICIPIILGSILGANLVLQINEGLLRKIIGILTLLILAFTIIKPKMGIEKANDAVKNHEYIIGAVLGFFLGIYSGFYSGGAGIFLAYILVLLFRQTFLEIAATRKIPHFFSAVMSGAIFAVHGVIIYSMGISLFLGIFLGSYIGAPYSDKIGNVWIKRLFFVIVLIMAIKLII
jgi:uncharacterized membrane protein YfcA